jgi:hypothetical protein
MSALSAGEVVLLSLWTLWLLAALALLPYPVGIALPTGLAALGLALILAGVVSWRAYLIAGLAVAVVAAVVTIVSQGRGPGPGPRPGQLRQALLASVSLAGLIWLLILRPTVPWLYPADIPIMIVTVAVLAAAEYGGWMLFDRTVQQRVSSAVAAERQDAARRAAEVASDLETEQRRRSAADEQNAALQRTVRELEDTQSRQEAELRRRGARLSDQDAELGRREVRLSDQEAELRRVRADLDQARAERDDALAALATHPAAWYRRLPDGTPAGGSPDVPGGAPAGPGPSAAGEAADVVVLRLTVDPPAVSRSAAGSQPGQLVQVTVERATSTLWPRLGETPGELQARAEDRLRAEIDGAIAQHSAQAIAQPAWNVVSQRWVATSWADINAAGGAVIDFQTDLHHLVLGQPVQELGTWIGLPVPVTGALAGLAEAAAIPGDRELTAVVRIIQIGGVVLGAMSGHPLLASACFKSLVHDESVRAVETFISGELGRLGLARAEPPGPASRPGPAGAPSAAEPLRPAHRPGPADGPSAANGPGPAGPGLANGPDRLQAPPAPGPSIPPPWTPIRRPGRDDDGPGRPGMSPF